MEKIEILFKSSKKFSSHNIWAPLCKQEERLLLAMKKSGNLVSLQVSSQWCSQTGFLKLSLLASVWLNMKQNKILATSSMTIGQRE